MEGKRTVHISTSAPTASTSGNLNDVWIYVNESTDDTNEILGLYVLVDIFSEDAQTAGGDGHMIHTYRWIKASKWQDEDTGECFEV